VRFTFIDKLRVWKISAFIRDIVGKNSEVWNTRQQDFQSLEKLIPFRA
jgi:hypothetical protein